MTEETNADNHLYAAQTAQATMELDNPSEDSIDRDAAETANRAKEKVTKSSPKWAFLGTVFIAFAIVGVQLGQGILLARLLGPSGRGEYATAVFYVQWLLYVGLLGGMEVICRHAAIGGSEQDLKAKRPLILRLRRSALRLGATTGTFTAIVVIALTLVAIPSEKRDLVPLAALCALSLVGQHIMLIMTAVDRGTDQFLAYNVRRMVAASAFPILLLITAFAGTLSVSTACILFVVASLIGMATCLIGVSKPFSNDYAPRISGLLNQSKPYALSQFAVASFERLDLLLVMWLASFTELGFYAAMVPAVYPLTVVPNTLGIFLFNAGTSKEKRLDRKRMLRVLLSSLGVQTVMTIGFLIAIGPVVRFAYGDSYEPAILYAMWLAPASAIRGILQGIDGYLKGRGRPMITIPARLAGITTLLLITFFFYQTHGVISIAIGATIAQTVCLLWISAAAIHDCRSDTDTDTDTNTDQ